MRHGLGRPTRRAAPYAVPAASHRGALLLAFAGPLVATLLALAVRI